MLLKVLFLLNVIIVVFSIKSLIKPKDIVEIIRKDVDKYGSSIMTLSYFIGCVVVSAVLLPFYVMCYNFSELIGWVSVIQVVLTIVGVIKSLNCVNKYTEGTLRNDPMWYRVGNVSFDVVYLMLVTKFII